MIRLYPILFIIFIFYSNISAQTGTDFWFAPPDVTEDHNPPGGEPIFVMVTSQGAPATVTMQLEFITKTLYIRLAMISMFPN